MKLDDKYIYDSFISILPHILWIQRTILRVKYIYLTRSKSKLTCKLVLANQIENTW